ncbi:MAG: hypothetical protein RIS70_3418 [Planctomycetota bacterium]
MTVSSYFTIGVGIVWLAASSVSLAGNARIDTGSNILFQTLLEFLSEYSASGSKPRDRDMLKPPIIPPIRPK